jgi:hypothetical protein
MKTQWSINKQWMLCILMSVLPAIGIAQDWEQIIKLVPTDRESNDWFGYSVSISGNYAIVGAFLENHDTSGAYPLTAAGSSYIFVKNGDSWIQQQKLVASDRDAVDAFGISVSISGDYAIVGAYFEDHDATGNNSLADAGSAYIFVRNGNNWIQQKKLVASDRAEGDHFGYAVSISGNYAIVGTYNESHDAHGLNPLLQAGSAYVFVRDGSEWTEQQKLVASDRAARDWFGYSASISGDYAIVGAVLEDPDAIEDAGSAYIFKRIDTTWIPMQKLVALDKAGTANFGNSVSISGDYAVVGAPRENYDTSDNIVPQAGAAYIFMRNNADWIQQQKIFSSERTVGLGLGYSVSISGDYVITGAPGPSKANIFTRNGSVWSEQKIIVSSDHFPTNEFGASVCISGEYAIIGAYQNDFDTSGSNQLPSAGAAYIFGPSSGTDVDLKDFTPGEIPNVFHLYQNYPNPFNPATIISFSIPSKSFVSLKVFDLLGREVASLVSEELSAGNYSREWDAASSLSGVYFYRMQTRPIDGGQAGNSSTSFSYAQDGGSGQRYIETKKLLLLK